MPGYRSSSSAEKRPTIETASGPSIEAASGPSIEAASGPSIEAASEPHWSLSTHTEEVVRVHPAVSEMINGRLRLQATPFLRKGVFNFMDLPRELRDHIFSYFWAIVLSFGMWFSGDLWQVVHEVGHERTNGLPLWLLTCKEFFHEGLRLYNSSTTPVSMKLIQINLPNQLRPTHQFFQPVGVRDMTLDFGEVTEYRRSYGDPTQLLFDDRGFMAVLPRIQADMTLKSLKLRFEHPGRYILSYEHWFLDLSDLEDSGIQLDRFKLVIHMKYGGSMSLLAKQDVLAVAERVCRALIGRDEVVRINSYEHPQLPSAPVDWVFSCTKTEDD